MRLFVYGLILGFVSCCLAAGDVYQAPDPEPTAEETAILEYMNRMRADPKADGERIYDEVKAKKLGWLGRGVDMEMFKKEMGELKGAPPLVMNLKLLDAARKHSFYMIKNGLTHVEQAGREGFVAANFGERISAAGYSGSAGGENCFAAAPGAYGSHAGFAIDAGDGGPGGMQPARGHRHNMASKDFREVGPGAVPNGQRLSVTHNFGNRNVARLAGGVIFIDKNGNNFYDVGEGLSGVKIASSDGASVMTWKSGGYALDLKSTGKVTLTAEFAGVSSSKTFEAGAENVKFDWIVPEKASLDLADKMLQKVDAVSNKQSPQYFSALVELYLACAGLGVDPERRAKIDDLTRDVGAKLSAAQNAVRDALKNFDAPKFLTLLDEQKKPFASTPAAAWFVEAGTVGTAKAQFAQFQKNCEDKNFPIQQKNTFVKQLGESAKTLKVPEFSAMMTALVAQAEAIAKPKPQRKER
ncbi:MAG TPA: CAP domain-containing protein [Planctomycetota bacterium]|nr:CAP domain-containing protein [Planctomycetota bacterium]